MQNSQNSSQRSHRCFLSALSEKDFSRRVRGGFHPELDEDIATRKVFRKSLP